ncbi:hypothetical protein [Amycolatopsis rubida]|uniref:Uncharacterized protein n=1 Tax=Amycolatopsis rubida TaxID=112413 RepID=A0A1I5W9R5_9PSEU|nr:hypothetical protein SAMN05421854_109124 [Amycolatopsis rubida]
MTWPSVPHSQSNIYDAPHRLSKSMHTCRDVLQTRADLDPETDEDVRILTAVVHGIRVELLKILHAEAAARSPNGSGNCSARPDSTSPQGPARRTNWSRP